MPQEPDAVNRSADARCQADVEAAAIPSRHGQNPEGARRMTARLRLMVRGATDPSRAQHQAMGQALMRGDPLADAVAQWMLDQGGARVWPLVERCIRNELRPGEAVSPALKALLAQVAAWPTWADAATLDEGARAMQSTGLHGMRVLRDAGLMAGYQASAINQTLLQTGALQDGAQRRVAHTTAWWMDVTEVGGMRPGAAGFEMTLKVRLMHAMVRQRLLRGETWSTAQWGLPVNQLDMQATYLAFSVVHLIALQTTGMWLSGGQREAVMHLWRLIGWVMGVEEGLLCLSEAHGRQTLLHNMLTQAPADEGSVKLARALMDEPLGRHYSGPFASWAGPFNKARHLSLVRWFVGADGMRALGLPMSLPWYPLLCMVPLGVRSTVLNALPGLQPGVAARQRARQRHYLSAVMQGPTSAAGAQGPGGAGRHQAG
jgi:hypothetical protein